MPDAEPSHVRSLLERVLGCALVAGVLGLNIRWLSNREFLIEGGQGDGAIFEVRP